jgi:hypothetical protein
MTRSLTSAAQRLFGAATGMIGSALLALALCAPAHAQGMLEQVLAPGKLSQAHAKYEESCQNCHVKFERANQDKLCADCHKDIGHDLQAKTGLHGRMETKTCRSCHTEHKGRDFVIVTLDKQKFDHAATNYVLRGGHVRVECAKCHVPNHAVKGYRVPAHECVDCHRKDDTHKGSLGAACADCHTEVKWKDAKFDHAKTHFPLLGKHDAVKCADCHKDTAFKDTPTACVACHRKDDRHKAQFGDRCDTCHVAANWKDIRFNHDTQTHYPLLAKHREVKCESCHTGNLYKDKLSTTCNDCHRKDDKHKGSLGTDCASCHSERGWKEPGHFDHAKTAFPLLGKHAQVQCKDCHKDAMFKEAPKACNACHEKDDKHKGSLGKECEACHEATSWKKTHFDHQKTPFPLMGKHVTTKCEACHKTTDYKKTPTTCYACHQANDNHRGQEGKACADCHDEKAWKPAPGFDHGLVRFPLLGKHAKVTCKSCHADAQFKNAGKTCNACHAKDDKHKKTLGVECEQCHNARSWTAWNFDHDKRTHFPLDGKHVGVACSACHVRPAEGRVVASSQCVACHTRDDVHHGSFGRACQQCHVTSSFKTMRSRVGMPSGQALSAPQPGASASRGGTP